MDSSQIERILRERPPDEPIYVPGTFRDAALGSWRLAIAGLAVVTALVVGIAVGFGLDSLREGGLGASPQRIEAADLAGTWFSDEMTWQQWVDGLIARGFDENDIAAFLTHDPFEERVRYALRFVDGELTIQASYDGAPLQTLSGGSYVLLDDGMLHYTEHVDNPPPIGEECQVTAGVEITGQRLRLSDLDARNCGLDARMAHTAFFDLSWFTHTD